MNKTRTSITAEQPCPSKPEANLALPKQGQPCVATRAAGSSFSVQSGNLEYQTNVRKTKGAQPSGLMGFYSQLPRGQENKKMKHLGQREIYL